MLSYCRSQSLVTSYVPLNSSQPILHPLSTPTQIFPDTKKDKKKLELSQGLIGEALGGVWGRRGYAPHAHTVHASGTEFKIGWDKLRLGYEFGLHVVLGWHLG